MARRNLFQPPAPPAEKPAEKPAPESKSRFPNTGAMSGVKSTLKDLSSNAVREIPPELIEEGGPKDRLAFSDADVAQLAESIRLHGQQVPVMVRPIADRPGSYRIVYGRRRLRALRLLGLPAKALVRALSDDEAILAQGQENAQRLDPSFIEKSLFAAELAASGYETAVILDALAIDKPMLSRMQKVARSIPEAVARRIGPAHGIGRRRWEELADLVNAHGLDLEALAETVLAPGPTARTGGLPSWRRRPRRPCAGQSRKRRPPPCPAGRVGRRDPAGADQRNGAGGDGETVEDRCPGIRPLVARTCRGRIAASLRGMAVRPPGRLTETDPRSRKEHESNPKRKSPPRSSPESPHLFFAPSDVSASPPQSTATDSVVGIFLPCARDDGQRALAARFAVKNAWLSFKRPQPSVCGPRICCPRTMPRRPGPFRNVTFLSKPCGRRRRCWG
ncbi:plasmid partitioning protein RepB (plasmid) [Rhodobacter capsulatus]